MQLARELLKKGQEQVGGEVGSTSTCMPNALQGFAAAVAWHAP